MTVQELLDVISDLRAKGKIGLDSEIIIDCEVYSARRSLYDFDSWCGVSLGGDITAAVPYQQEVSDGWPTYEWRTKAQLIFTNREDWKDWYKE